MKKARLGTTAAIAAALLGAGTAMAATADADAPQPSIAYAGHLVAGPGATTVKITYTCNTGAGAISHLFVAVKQGPLVDPGAHSSSQYANTFYSTNWQSDAGPNAVVCDGVRHTQTIVLKPQPGFTPSVPRLHSGPALVQLCLYDNVTQFGDEGPLDGGMALDYTMQDVHAGNGQG